jgi:hypothetical protein
MPKDKGEKKAAPKDGEHPSACLYKWLNSPSIITIVVGTAPAQPLPLPPALGFTPVLAVPVSHEATINLHKRLHGV